jgi:hypothetical protein
MTARSTFCGALALALFPLAGHAQAWEPGAGCRAFLTVQTRGCQVVNYWRCSDAPAGWTFEAAHDADGPASAAIYDDEAQWLETRWSDGWRDRLLPGQADPVSQSELRDYGIDSYDFDLLSTAEDGAVMRTRVRGVDILTGETEEVDGLRLEKTRFLMVLSDDADRVTVTGEGVQYYSHEHGLFLSGRETWNDRGTETEEDYTPVAILRPGEEGFGATEPTTGCGAETAGPVKDEETAPRSIPEPAPVAETAPETGPDTAPAPEPVTEPAPETQVEPAPEAAPQPEAETEVEAEVELESEPETEREAEPEAAPEAAPDADDTGSGAGPSGGDRTD